MAFEDTTFNPILNSSFGAIELLDNEFRMASEAFVDGDLPKLYKLLEAIHTELIYWIDKNQSKKKEEIISYIDKLRLHASRLDEVALKQLHVVLLRYANETGLRLKTRDNLPGILRG